MIPENKNNNVETPNFIYLLVYCSPTSSGQMVNLKFNKSSGSGNSVVHVFGKVSSFKSE